MISGEEGGREGGREGGQEQINKCDTIANI